MSVRLLTDLELTNHSQHIINNMFDMLYFFRVSNWPKIGIFFRLRVQLNFRIPPSYFSGSPAPGILLYVK